MSLRVGSGTALSSSSSSSLSSPKPQTTGPNKSKKRKQTKLRFQSSSQPDQAAPPVKRSKLEKSSSLLMLGKNGKKKSGGLLSSAGRSKSLLGGRSKGKKMVIKPFKVKPKPPAEFEQTTFEELSKAVSAVHSQQSVPHSLEHLYRQAENLCLHKKASVLYGKLYAQCERHIQTTLEALVQQHKPGTAADQAFLRGLNTIWSEHCSQMMTIRGIFLYLDRTFVIQSADVAEKSLWDMGLRLVAKHLLQLDGVATRTVNGILTLIHSERQGEAIDRQMVKSLLRMLSALELYCDRFESEFLVATKSFYEDEGRRLVSQLNVPDYLSHVCKRRKEEHERVQHYLEHTTSLPLIKCLEAHLVATHVKAMLDKGFADLMANSRIADLAKMYSLIKAVDQLAQLQNAFSAWVKATGLSLVNCGADKERELVARLLELKATVVLATKDAFESNEEFAYAEKAAWEGFINKKAGLVAELLAKFADHHLRSGSRGLSDEELEQLLDKLMVVFRYIHGKDVFEAFYKKDLAKRLLLNKSSSLDAEKGMIARLKAECGTTFTNKLEGMFKDMDLSKELAEGWRILQKKDQAPDADALELSCHVLTTGFWPQFGGPAGDQVVLPSHIAQAQQKFKQFYLKKHSGRQVRFDPSLTHCVVGVDFPKGRKELAMSAFQAIVMVQFNHAKVVSFQQLAEQAKIEDGELKRTLQSLASGKVRVLQKKSKGREVVQTDQFRLNKDFTHKLFRIKINSIQIKETTEEKKRTNESIFADRQYHIDAAMVRIMKSRKTLSHQMLMTEAINQLKFPATVSDLKKRIASLLEREYIERDKNQSTVYNYLA